VAWTVAADPGIGLDLDHGRPLAGLHGLDGRDHDLATHRSSERFVRMGFLHEALLYPLSYSRTMIAPMAVAGNGQGYVCLKKP
jgi:hypothetical protein